MNTSWIDLSVLGLYLCGTIAIGLWVSRGHQDLSDYLLGDRNLPWWAILGSIVATETSTATFLSIPGVAYSTNIAFLQIAVGYVIGRVLVATVILPMYFRGDLMTAYQVLSDRFGGATRWICSMIFLVTRNLGDGLRLFLTAVVIEQLTGASMLFSVTLMGALTIFYTFFGGMKSVVWNDCVQLVVYLLGGIAALVVIAFRLPDGWSEIQLYAWTHDKFHFLNTNLDFTTPYTIWGGVVGGIFLTLGTHGTDQMMVQRYMSATSQREAAKALTLSGVFVFLQFCLFLYIGIALATYFTRFPPETPFARGDQVFAAFIVHDLPRGVGLVGLLLAAVFSAAMSTLSSSLNSSAACAVNDLYVPLMKKRQREVSEGHLLSVSRKLTIVFGIVQSGLALLASTWQKSVVDNALSIAGFSAGLLLGIFMLALFVPRARQQSALVGLVAGLGTLLTIWCFTKIAWPWYALMGCTATFCVGCLMAMATTRRRD